MHRPRGFEREKVVACGGGNIQGSGLDNNEIVVVQVYVQAGGFTRRKDKVPDVAGWG